jgi:predicted exporter
MGACMRRPKRVLAVGAVLTVVAGVLATGLEFEESMKTMRPPENRGIRVTTEVGERFGSGFDYMMLVLRGDTPGEAIALADRAAEGARRLVDQGVLYGFSGIDSLIPPPAQQTAVLGWLAEGRENGLRLERIRATFRRELAAEGLRAEPFEEGVALLASAITPAGPVEAGDFGHTPQTRALLDRYLQPRDGGGWESVVYLYPPENRWRREPPLQAVELTDSLGPRAILTGTNVINQRVRGIVRADAWFAAVLGLVLVAILLWLDFRSLRHTFLSLTPLAMGIVWMLGAMGALGMKLNFMNIFVTTMIIGIGVDYGLHVLHRYRELRDAADEEVVRGLVETGNAIVVAALSTVCGFGSLVFSHYPGLRSVGMVAVLGAVCTAVVAITMLPSFLALRRRARAAAEARRAGAPAAGGAGGAG